MVEPLDVPNLNPPVVAFAKKGLPLTAPILPIVAPSFINVASPPSFPFRFTAKAGSFDLEN